MVETTSLFPPCITLMALNIKNQETCDLARELAELTDDTMTGAITKVLRDRVEQIKRERDREELLRDLRAIRDRVSKKLKPEPSVEEIIESMYGEYGEPI